MIINFTVGNYRSFKDKKVLSMEATAIKELNESVIEKKDIDYFHQLLFMELTQVEKVTF